MALPTPSQLLDAAEAATSAASRAEDLRSELRWRTAPDEPDRQRRIEEELTNLSVAMIPVRSAINRFAGGHAEAPDGIEQALRTASAYVQYQRKQLKKMRR